MERDVLDQQVNVQCQDFFLLNSYSPFHSFPPLSLPLLATDVRDQANFLGIPTTFTPPSAPAPPTPFNPPLVPPRSSATFLLMLARQPAWLFHFTAGPSLSNREAKASPGLVSQNDAGQIREICPAHLNSFFNLFFLHNLFFSFPLLLSFRYQQPLRKTT